MSESSATRPHFDANDKLLALGLAAVLGVVLLRLSETWWRSDHMSHGFLVPVVSYFVALSRAPALAGLPRAGDWRGLVGLALSLLLAFAGTLAPSMTFAGLGVVGAITSAIWLRRGWAFVRALAFPLAFLLFMVPPPDEWHAPLVNWLQRLASESSVSVLYALGVPVYLEGYIIQMAGGMQVEVAEACSGATSLYTLSALGVLLAVMSLTRRATRLALLALVVPAALLGNLARVVATVLLCLEIGLERATSGWVHTALGLLTYVVAVGSLLGADALLRPLDRRRAA